MNHIVHVTKELNSSVFGYTEEEYTQQAMQIGGMCTFDLSAELWKNLVAHCGNADIVNSVFAHGFTSYILMYTDYLEESGLNEQEINAILLHEEGHINLSHNLLNAGKRGLVCEVSQELQADAYAVKLVGKDVMRSAINITCMHIIACMVKYHNVDYNIAYDHVMENSVIAVRLSALQ